ncbi:hypothetical protein QP027_05665 [Corynebacterium breve]|uniref:Uncharacterized protein n=1 Tax=Corynebacterium breve TaxID=3049799 RepID=A0ABY8VII6_9CORY|nr:DUF6676 family protein [Corynebacterium breve]WIM68867.1 hypothetical protein QP027_05665 [Corynebacterium breve]
MAQYDIDLTPLADQLQQDGVAFGSDNPANWQLEETLLEALEQASGEGLPQFGVVVLEETPPGAGVRDVAQDLSLMTEIDTVIVRTPHTGAAVSETLTRSEIERAQDAMLAQVDYAQGLKVFAESAMQQHTSWGIVLGTIALLGVIVVVATAFCVKR